MPKQPVWKMPFAFSEDQRRDLLLTLRRDDEAGNELVSSVEMLVPRFRSDYNYYVTQETETPRQARTILARIARNAKALSEDLQNLDPMGSSGAFISGCSRLGREIESLNYLPGELLLIQAAATGGMKLIGPVQRGRRDSPTELQFIANVASLYQHHLKLRPSTGRGTMFIAFMSRVFFHADSTYPRSSSDISKFAQKALANYLYNPALK